MKINKTAHKLSGAAAGFYSLLAFMALGGMKAEACPDTPDIISLPGSTFIEERITVERNRRNHRRGGGHIIHFGNTQLTHNGKCWHSITHGGCLSALLKNDNWVAITKNRVTVGKLELSDAARMLWVYSTNRQGEKAEKPYLKFREEVVYMAPGQARQTGASGGTAALQVAEYRLRASAWNFIRGSKAMQRPIGQYESVSKAGGGASRGISAPAARKKGRFGALNLRGRRIVSRGCQVESRPL